jgi:hypothetical protein
MVYQKLLYIEQTVKELDDDFHRPKPEFLIKLRKSEEEKTYTFETIEEMEKQMDEIE